MAEDYKFTWDKLGICFPEWKNDMVSGDFYNAFPKIPIFSKDYIHFAYKEGYGIQVHLNQTIEPWIQAAPERTKKVILKMHSDSSHKLYKEVVGELGDSINTLEGWRKYITKNVKGIWEGYLQNNIDFENERDNVSLWDYYRFYVNSESKNNSPTAILFKISELPKASLNETWQRYAKLAEHCSKDAIGGKTLGECIKNADEIYKMADELKGLKF